MKLCARLRVDMRKNMRFFVGGAIEQSVGNFVHTISLQRTEVGEQHKCDDVSAVEGVENVVDDSMLPYAR